MHRIIHFITFSLSLLFCGVWDRILLCGPGWLRTSSGLPSSAPWVRWDYRLSCHPWPHIVEMVVVVVENRVKGVCVTLKRVKRKMQEGMGRCCIPGNATAVNGLWASGTHCLLLTCFSFLFSSLFLSLPSPLSSPSSLSSLSALSPIPLSLVLGIEPRILPVIGKHVTTELYPQPYFYFL